MMVADDPAYPSPRRPPERKRESCPSDKPKVIVLCGLSRFVDIMAVCAWLIERDEQAIAIGLHLLPAWYPNVPADHLAEAECASATMDALHLRKIDMADEVFVVNRQDYIGTSTANEVKYAQAKGKPIRWYTHDPVGRQVEAMVLQRKLA